MERPQIVKKINEFLIEEFEAEIEEISADANFHEALDLDSLDYVDLVVLVEESFKFKMSGNDFKSIATFNDFYDFIHNYLNKSQLV